jgi:hypothetical protein
MQAEARLTGDLRQALRQHVGTLESNRALAESLGLQQRLQETMEVRRRRYEELAEGDEDVPGFDESAWERATEFVRRNAEQVHALWKRNVDAPALFPTSDGGIDIEWVCRGRKLAVHIPEDPGTPGSFYGKNPSGTTTQGTFHLSDDNTHLLVWLTL